MKVRNPSSSIITSRRISYRSILPTVFFFAVLLPLIFIRTVFLASESPSLCVSLDCVGFGWRFGVFGGSEKLAHELAKELIIAENGKFDERGIDSFPSTFNDLVEDMISNRLDIKTFASKTKAMVLKMEQKVQLAKQQELIYKHLASYGIPKSMNCLSLSLAEEYSINALARSPLPSPEFVYRLSNSSYHHFALLTDNVLAASVVVSSTIKRSSHPEKLVFHIITDKKTYAPMYAWFSLHTPTSAVVEVKGLHQFDWPLDVNVRVKEMLDIHRSTRYHFDYSSFFGTNRSTLEDLRPNSISLMDQLWIYLPELFPDLNRVILLDDDIVVQRDLSPLWELNLNGRVNGAVVRNLLVEEDRHDVCLGKKYGDYLNFSHPEIYSKFKFDNCAWLSGMNVFDLDAWRRTNITEIYHHWLTLNIDAGYKIWIPGAYPPALISFEGQVHPLDPSWHIAGLGHQPIQVGLETLKEFAVLHFSGPAKPWLEMVYPELRKLWNIHVNYSNEYISNCKFWD
ncbi:hypothetical protein ACHQM5_018193 [Ranunculus cassubicifolius]